MPVIINLPKKTGIDETVIDNKIEDLKNEYFQLRNTNQGGNPLKEITLNLNSSIGSYLLVCDYYGYACAYILIKGASYENYNKIPINEISDFTITTTISTVTIKSTSGIFYSLTKLG